MSAITTSIHPHRSAFFSRRAVIAIGQLLFVAAVFGLLWYELAPPSFGGHTYWVVTDGSSMLPIIRSGSLVLLHKQARYKVGEIAAYHNPILHAVVLHKIVALSNGRYTFKGVNNPFPDPGTVTSRQIIGTRFFTSAMLGRFFLNIHTPYVGAILLGGAGMFATWGGRDKAEEDEPSSDPEPAA